MSLYLRVKELAEKQGQSIRALEILCGFGNGTIKKWETQSPSFEKIIVIANKLNCSLQYLADGDEPKPQQTQSTITPGGQAVLEQLQGMTEAECFQIAGAIPFIRMMQDNACFNPPSKAERTATNLFVGSSSRD